MMSRRSCPRFLQYCFAVTLQPARRRQRLARCHRDMLARQYSKSPSHAPHRRSQLTPSLSSSTPPSGHGGGGIGPPVKRNESPKIASEMSTPPTALVLQG